MIMLRSIIISPDERLAKGLETALGLTGEVSVQKTLIGYPTAIELVRTLRAHAPAVIFLSFESIPSAHAVAELLESEASHIPIVAINREYDDKTLRESMRLGIREFVAHPFDRAMLKESIAQIAAQIKRKPTSLGATNEIFSFLPSKAGSGTSTVALNLSAAMAKTDTRVLLSDFDLNSGMMRFLLKLTNERSVGDAVDHSLNMDENLWPQMVTSVQTLDILHAGPMRPNLRIDSNQIRGLIDFMRHRYQALCFDLSGNLEKYSVEIMQESKRILMVCTPEKASLQLAREKLEFLRTLELEERVAVVLNRVSKVPLFSVPQVEEILGVPVAQVFPNDYAGVHKAISSASWIPATSDLGKRFAQYANVLLEPKAPEKTPVKKKFLDFFAMSSAKQAIS